jgi:hypothetical protein
MCDENPQPLSQVDEKQKRPPRRKPEHKPVSTGQNESGETDLAETEIVSPD